MMNRIILFAVLLVYSNLYSAELKIKIYNQDLLPVETNDFHSVCQQIFQYECKRLEFDITLTISVVLQNSNPLEIRGQIVPDSSKILIYIDSLFTKEKLYGIFAHELAHILQIRWINTYRGGIHYFDEGFACWLAGKYYLKWQQHDNFQDAVRSIIKEERYDINNQFDGNILPPYQRDIMYNAWSSFVEYLINLYGLKGIHEFCTYLNEINNKHALKSEILTEEDKVEEREILNNSKIRQKEKDDQLKKWIEKVVHEKFNKRRDVLAKKHKEAYLKIFGTDFDELKNNWIKSIAI